MAAPNHLHGDPANVEIPFDTTDATVTFAVGDLLYADSIGVAHPYTTSDTLTTNFLGVCRQTKRAAVTHIFGNSTSGVIVASTAGEYEYDCTDTIQLNTGDLVGPTGATTVYKVSNESISLGTVVKRKASGLTRVRIRITGSVVPFAKAVP